MVVHVNMLHVYNRYQKNIKPSLRNDGNVNARIEDTS
jgi:hypothetical protein